MTQKEQKLFDILERAIDEIKDKEPLNLDTFINIHKSGVVSGKIMACLVIRRYLIGKIDANEIIKELIKS